MKIFNKRRLPDNLRILGSHIFKNSFNPFSFKSRLNSPSKVSDFFIWSPNFKKIEFIAENINALLSGEESKVLHEFIFYNKKGEFIRSYKYETEKFFYKIILPANISKDKYISFVHFAHSKLTIKEILKKVGVNKKLNISSQSRGYTIFSPNKSSLGSSVHGNLGGIASNNEKTLKQRSLFIYTPAYFFKKINCYDLVFNNPTNRNLLIKLTSLSNEILKEIIIKPMGTDYIQIKNFNGGINIESKLPICRPFIFKNTPPNNLGFDVFHG